MDDDTEQGYTWEAEYERPWEAIQEDFEGHLVAPDDSRMYKVKRRKLFDHHRQMKLGMMRHLIVVLDMTSSMEDKDLRPDRFSCTKAVLEKFFDEFFDQNPISQIGLLATRDGKALKLSDLSGNPRLHKTALQQCHQCSGETSLQNAMDLALKLLRHVPSHASRELLIIHGSLSSCDPGNIFNTIEELSQQNIQCSIIGLGAQVKLCQTICQKTQGTYNVILDEVHFRDLVMQHCRPPIAKASAATTLIKMGLTLVLAPHLIRSYHHLFPLRMFHEVQIDTNTSQIYCFGCQTSLNSEMYMCPDCKQCYCIDCDLYCHETLHNCPGCQSLLQTNP